jgi:phage-Barnase-EndoU-ColicinE5/D-RelE like nuclease4
MGLTCQDLYVATENPRINDLTLDLLREYYETYLHPYIYQFEFVDPIQNAPRTIELRFDQENFCHLLGIDTIVKYIVNGDEINQYKGQPGWDNIVKGTLTFGLLRDPKTKQRFKDMKSKFVFFYLIPKFIESPKAVLYDKGKVDGNTRVDCEILFYDQLQNAYVHIGIKLDDDLGYYIPKTFLIEKTKNKDGLKYINDQTEIIVSKIAKLAIEVE